MNWTRILSDAKMDKMCVRKGRLYLTTRNRFPLTTSYYEVFDVDTGAPIRRCSGDDVFECNWTVLRECRILAKHMEPYVGFYGTGWSFGF